MAEYCNNCVRGKIKSLNELHWFRLIFAATSENFVLLEQ